MRRFSLAICTPITWRTVSSPSNRRSAPLDPPIPVHVHLAERFLLTSCSRRNDTRWHGTTSDDTRRHVQAGSVPGCSNLRIRCPQGRGSSTLPSRTHSDLRIFSMGASDEWSAKRRLAHTCSHGPRDHLDALTSWSLALPRSGGCRDRTRFSRTQASPDPVASR